VAQLEIPLATVLSAARTATSQGARIVLNVTPVQGLPDDLFRLLDPVVVNETEAAGLLGLELPATEAAIALVGLGARSAVVTGGPRGAAAAWPGGSARVAAHAPGPVVDTTGAGDALCGALAAALAAGSGLEEALARGCAFAGVSVTRSGAWPSYPGGPADR
jgi:ribokinase